MSLERWYEWRDAPSGDFAVVGDPVAHSWSPRMHRAAYAALNYSWEYRAIRVPAGELEQALKALAQKKYRGVNVTVPLKQEAFKCTRPEIGAISRVGAVNTIALPSMMSTNTDGIGLYKALLESHVGPGASVLILGAGGSARSAGFVLHRYGYHVTVWNRTTETAAALAGEFGLRWVETPRTAGFDAVLNATSASLADADLPIEWSGRGLAMDMMYAIEATPFMQRAQSAGWRTMDGREMLLWQGATSFVWWTGIDPPIGVMREAISA